MCCQGNSHWYMDSPVTWGAHSSDSCLARQGWNGEGDGGGLDGGRDGWWGGGGGGWLFTPSWRQPANSPSQLLLLIVVLACGGWGLLNWSHLPVLLGWLVACLTSQQHASVSQGRICSENSTCCHTEIEVAIKLSISPSHSILTPGQPVPACSADPIMPGTWQGNHWSANF